MGVGASPRWVDAVWIRRMLERSIVHEVAALDVMALMGARQFILLAVLVIPIPCQNHKRFGTRQQIGIKPPCHSPTCHRTESVNNPTAATTEFTPGPA